MTVRGLSLVVLLLALGIGGYGFARQAQETGPTSELVVEAKADATAGVAAVNFQAAAPLLAAWFAEHSSYAGAQLPPSFGVRLVRADAVSYCLQDLGGAQHVTGSGGTVQPGPC